MCTLSCFIVFYVKMCFLFYTNTLQTLCLSSFFSWILINSTSTRPPLSRPSAPPTSRPATSAKTTCFPKRTLRMSVPTRVEMRQSHRPMDFSLNNVFSTMLCRNRQPAAVYLPAFTLCAVRGSTCCGSLYRLFVQSQELVFIVSSGFM